MGAAHDNGEDGDDIDDNVNNDSTIKASTTAAAKETVKGTTAATSTARKTTTAITATAR